MGTFKFSETAERTLLLSRHTLINIYSTYNLSSWQSIFKQKKKINRKVALSFWGLQYSFFILTANVTYKIYKYFTKLFIQILLSALFFFFITSGY
jgi:hypothetical protein